MPEAKALLGKYPAIAQKIENGELSWDSFSKELSLQ
jgi:hypothetical protein